jgi:lipid-A-disaccharide synthase-like uncharacterized protein
MLFAVVLFSARKLVDWMESDKPTMAEQIWVDKPFWRPSPFWRGSTGGGLLSGIGVSVGSSDPISA